MSNTHHLKSWPEFFQAIKAGHRTHELRRNDRHFAIGDILALHEFDPDAKNYTGEEILVEITSLTSFAQPCAVSGEALNPSFCIMSVRLTTRIARPQIFESAKSSNLHDSDRATTNTGPLDLQFENKH
jgi:hypothetical protein